MPQVFGVSHMGYLYLLVSTLALYLTIFEVWESRWFFFLLLWVSLAFGLVSCGFFRFFGVSEDIIGKRKDGTLPLWSMVLFFPWLLPVNIVWHLSCLYHSRFENTFDEVFEGIYVGRRPRSAADIPENVALVVDLTCEFAADDSVSWSPSWRYICCPSFDTMVPTNKSRIVETLTTMLECEEPIFIHCAFGHGRSATFAAAWLILKNHVSDAEGAEALMKRGRATVHINAIQRKGLVQYLEEMKKKG
mmetsp:Transcript_31242/g.42941  ORF Transcript_31242/g.42941 Transcript_31242/m.42941 type:complete len:247 (-) Transcript_31242:55-795(-)